MGMIGEKLDYHKAMEIGTVTKFGIYEGIKKDPFGRDAHTFENCHGGKHYRQSIEGIEEIPIEEWKRNVKSTQEDMKIFYGL